MRHCRRYGVQRDKQGENPHCRAQQVSLSKPDIKGPAAKWCFVRIVSGAAVVARYNQGLPALIFGAGLDSSPGLGAPNL
jgi:hypothetical protein